MELWLQTSVFTIRLIISFLSINLRLISYIPYTFWEFTFALQDARKIQMYFEAFSRRSKKLSPHGLSEKICMFICFNSISDSMQSSAEESTTLAQESVTPSETLLPTEVSLQSSSPSSTLEEPVVKSKNQLKREMKSAVFMTNKAERRIAEKARMYQPSENVIYLPYFPLSISRL